MINIICTTEKRSKQKDRNFKSTFFLLEFKICLLYVMYFSDFQMLSFVENVKLLFRRKPYFCRNDVSKNFSV